MVPTRLIEFTETVQHNRYIPIEMSVDATDTLLFVRPFFCKLQLTADCCYKLSVSYVRQRLEKLRMKEIKTKSSFVDTIRVNMRLLLQLKRSTALSVRPSGPPTKPIGERFIDCSKSNRTKYGQTNEVLY